MILFSWFSLAIIWFGTYGKKKRVKLGLVEIVFSCFISAAKHRIRIRTYGSYTHQTKGSVSGKRFGIKYVEVSRYHQGMRGNYWLMLQGATAFTGMLTVGSMLNRETRCNFSD